MACSFLTYKISRISQTTSWELAGVPDHREWKYRSTQNAVGWKKEEKKRGRVSWDRICTQGVEELKQGWDPHIRAISWDRVDMFEAAREWSSWSVNEWSENHTDKLCCGPTYPGQGCKSLEHVAARSWNIGIIKQSQGEVCYWLRGDGLRGCEGGNCSGECLWRKDRQL